MQISAALLLTTMASYAAAAKQMQINYYSDQRCNNYVGQVDVTWAPTVYAGKTNCFNYNYGTSMNIANCYVGGCLCNLYKSKDCKGEVLDQIRGPGGCGGYAYLTNSFACYYGA
ncbi:hypothetical protein ACJ41O_005655 [Fusarium nematophilum]